LIGNEFSVTAINKEIYITWQRLLHSLWPGKPVMLDFVWLWSATVLVERPKSCCDTMPFFTAQIMNATFEARCPSRR